jgi:hypothetical protein
LEPAAGNNARSEREGGAPTPFMMDPPLTTAGDDEWEFPSSLEADAGVAEDGAGGKGTPDIAQAQRLSLGGGGKGDTA